MEFKEPIDQLIRDPREFTRDVKFPDASKLRIYDTSLRDGEQMPGLAYTPEQKYEICRRLSDIGVHIMDVGFPAVSEDERRSLQLIMQGKKKGEIRADLDVVVMCRSNTKDIDATLEALDGIGVAPSEVTFFIFTSGSDLHMKYKIGKTLLAREGRNEWLREWRAELWYVERGRAGFCLGAYRDALWLRRNAARRPLLDSPAACIVILAILAAWRSSSRSPGSTSSHRGFSRACTFR